MADDERDAVEEIGAAFKALRAAAKKHGYTLGSVFLHGTALGPDEAADERSPRGDREWTVRPVGDVDPRELTVMRSRDVKQ